MTKKQMRDVKRKTFMSFFEGFFDKYPNESMKMRNLDFDFTDPEKNELVEKYFVKYFNEKLDMKKTAEEKSIETENQVSSMLNADQPVYVGKLDSVAENFKDAFLGKSKGILGAYGNKQQNEDMMDVLNER